MLFAQLNLPNTLEGVGSPAYQNPSAFGAAQGLVASESPSVGINFLNPATYSSFKSTNFDIGLQTDNVNYEFKPASIAYNYSNIRLSNVHIGMPIISNKLGLTLGAYPYSLIGYNLSYTHPVANSPTSDSVFSASKGSGGSYVLHVGVGYAINKYVSVGFNLGYLWGSKNGERKELFFGSKNVTLGSHLGTLTKKDIFFGSIYAVWGAMITVPFKNGQVLRLGGTASIPLNVDASIDGFVSSLASSASTSVLDTVVVYQKRKISMTFPVSYRGGMSFANAEENFTVGVQYASTMWSTFHSEADMISGLYQLKNDDYFSFGLSFRPVRKNDIKERSYFSYITYSLGSSYGFTRLNEKENKRDVTEFSVSLGFFFPLKRYSYTNQHGGISVNAKYAWEGLDGDNLFPTSTFGLQIGFTLGDIWFLKRKID